MSSDTPNDPLAALGQTPVPDARAAAKARALAAGQAAFTAHSNKSHKPTQGVGWRARLSSIVPSKQGHWIMDMRLPIGTAAIALLVLPLGYQLYSSTVLTPAERPVITGTDPIVETPPVIMTPPAQTSVPEPVTIAAPQDAEARVGPEAPAELTASEPAAPAKVGSIAQSAAPIAEAPMAEPPMVDTAAPPPAGLRLEAPIVPSPVAVPPMVTRNSASDMVLSPPTDPSGDEFTAFDEQRLKVVADEPVSTFSIDVDTASYGYARTLIEDGFVPEPNAVRIEEMINYFPYDYAPADSALEPFKPTMAIYPTPWNPKTQLLQIGIKGYVPPAGIDRPSNLVFLIDTSGSMDEPDKLPLLKRAFALLVDQLSDNDTVSIVVYAGSAGVVLEPTNAREKAKILGAIDNLYAGGSTAGAEGIALAYQLAEQARVTDGSNRVILATDGDFNVGIDDPDQLEDFIADKRDGGITLSVLGFGRGNLDDATMQALAQNGNGNASYISSFREAQKVLVEEGGGTLEMIAKDVKIQVEFNPAMVSEYRLIGYETRALNREDFNNDAVDAGDIGAGHTVTALYEITPAGSGAELVDPLRYGTSEANSGQAGDEIAFLKMRYKLPADTASRLLEVPVTPSLVQTDITEVTDDMRFAAAVAAFGQKLKGSDYGGAMAWDAIEALAKSGRGPDENGYRAEFIQLLQTAALLKPDARPAQ